MYGKVYRWEKESTLPVNRDGWKANRRNADSGFWIQAVATRCGMSMGITVLRVVRN
jgi:hypothetical protein